MKRDIVDYEIVVREVSPEDGGGFHVYAPTLGAHSIYGVGDDVVEALECFVGSFHAIQEFWESKGITMPTPTYADVEYKRRLHAQIDMYGEFEDLAVGICNGSETVAGNNNFAFAA